jgi:hypothetical protein
MTFGIWITLECACLAAWRDATVWLTNIATMMILVMFVIIIITIFIFKVVSPDETPVHVRIAAKINVKFLQDHDTQIQKLEQLQRSKSVGFGSCSRYLINAGAAATDRGSDLISRWLS